MIMHVPKHLNNCEAIQKKRDAQTAFALCAVFFIPAINNFVNALLQIGLGLKISFLTPVSYIFMAFVSGFFLYKLIIRRIGFMLMFCLAFFGSVLSYTLYPEIRDLIYGSPVDLVYSPINKLMFYCVPVLMGTACIRDYEKLFSKMRNWSLITAMTGVITFLVVIVIKGRMLQYMTYSYFMLLPICVCYENANMTKNKVDLIVAILASVSIVMCGARGALVSLFLYFVLSLLRYDFRKMPVGQFVKLAIIFLLLLSLILFYSELLESVAQTLEQFNIDSRTIRYIQEGRFWEDSGRSNINEALMEGLIDNPLGYGLYGDRYIARIFGSMNYRYAHNIFLEMFCNFGFVIGSIVIAFVVYFIVRLVRSTKGTNEIYLVFSIIPYGLFQLFFSSSYLENILFWALMGLSVGRNKNHDTVNGEKL